MTSLPLDPRDLIPAVIEAGVEIMDVFHKGPESRTKADASPVTEADERAEKVILRHLEQLAPDIPVVAEEQAADIGLPSRIGDRFFLVDPLDGTKEFIKKGNDFTVNIGLVDQGKPVLGIVYAPADGRLYMGASGLGASRAEVRNGATSGDLVMLKTTPVASPPRIVASKSHRTPETDRWLAAFPDADLVSVGSSLKFCLVAEGAADFYPRLGPTMEWDTAAGDAVLRAAGGRVVDEDGAAFGYGKEGFRNGWFLAWGDAQANPPGLAGIR